MKNTLKALGLVFLGLIIWTGCIYIALAFLKLEGNPFLWSQNLRGGLLFMVFCYVCFSPLMIIAIKDELKN